MGDTVSDLERKNLLASAPGALSYETIPDLRLRQYKTATAGLSTVSDFEKQYREGRISNEALSDSLQDLRRKDYLRLRSLSEPSQYTTDDLHYGVEANPSGGPTVSVVGNSSSTTGSVSTLTATIPTGLQTGDRIYALLINTDVASSSTITPTVPAGWSVVSALADQGTMQRALYMADYTAGLSPIVWNASAARKMAFVCVAVRGLTQAHITALFNESASTVNTTFPTATATKTGIAVRLVCRKDNLSTGVTLPGGHSLIAQAIGVATGPSAHVMACQTPAPVGALAAGTAVWTVASLNSTSWTILVA